MPAVRLDLDRLFRPGEARTSGWRRMPTIAAEAMVATSHPLATRAGVRALERGGNAVDAALAAAAVLCVAEPPATGIGGDAFAMVWREGELHGLNGSGRSPAVLDSSRVDASGPRSVTVPGAVRAWADLAERFGRLGLDAAIAPAVDLAERGLACTARIGDIWSRAERAPWPAPAIGGRYALPVLGATLRRIAEGGPDAFYRGPVAEAIAAACWLAEDDLAAHESEWVEPLRLSYRGVEVCELPPNGQGAAALMALGIYEELEASLHTQVEAMKLALAEAYALIGDVALPEEWLSPEHLAARRALVRSDSVLGPEPTRLPIGGTTYLCVVDADRMAVSFIQSVYESFGSGIVPGALGFALQNRGAGFVEDEGHPNRLAPSKRPFHTIIPGMLLDGGELLGPFGVMGGAMQAQGHFQVVRSLVDDGLDPQSALDAPRWRVGPDWAVAVEPALADEAEALRSVGHRANIAANQHQFGVGQIIVTLDEALIAGSDSRGDGHSAGL